jgi:hypothetical protein
LAYLVIDKIDGQDIIGVDKERESVAISRRILLPSKCGVREIMIYF